MSGSELERSKENGGLHTRLKFIFAKFVIAVSGPIALSMFHTTLRRKKNELKTL